MKRQLTHDTGFQWSHLPQEIKLRVFECLPKNEVICNVRLASKDLRGTVLQFQPVAVVSFAEPVPRHALQWFFHNKNVADFGRGLRLKLLERVAAMGDIDTLNLALDRAGFFGLPDEALRGALVAGHLSVCDHLVSRYNWSSTEWPNLVAAAATANMKESCEWLIGLNMVTGDFQYGRDAAAAVCATFAAGHVSLGEWLLQPSTLGNRLGLLEHGVHAVLEVVADIYDLATLARVHAACRQVGRVSSSPPVSVPQAAALSKTSDWEAKVEFLTRVGYPRDPCTLPPWLRGMAGQPRTWSHYRESFAKDALDNQEAVELSNSALAAAREGRLSDLQELHAEYGEKAMNYGVVLRQLVPAALKCGHSDVLAWLLDMPDVFVDLDFIDIDIAFNSMWLSATQTESMVAVLELLRNNGVLFKNYFLWVKAANVGCAWFLEWFKGHCRPPNAVESKATYLRACQNVDAATFRTLRRIGLTMDDGLAGYLRDELRRFHFSEEVIARALQLVDEEI